MLIYNAYNKEIRPAVLLSLPGLTQSIPPTAP